MARANDLQIRVGVEGGQQAARDLKTVAGATSDLGQAADRAAPNVVEMGAAFAVAQKGLDLLLSAAVAAARALPEMAAELNTLAKTARDAGTTASDLDTLAGALGLVTRGGVDAGKLLQTLDRQLGKAASGSAEAAAAFKALGLSTEDLAGVSGTDRLAIIADRMQRLGSDAERAAISAKLFEEQGQSLASVWRDGGDVLRDAAAQVREAGVASDEAARNAEAFQDATDLLSRRLMILKQDALAPLLPVFTELVGHYGEMITRSGHAVEPINKIGLAILAVSKTAEQAGAAVRYWLDQLSGLSDALSTWFDGVAAGGFFTEKGRALLSAAVDSVVDPWGDFQTRLDAISESYDQMVGRIVESSARGAEQIEQAAPMLARAGAATGPTAAAASPSFALGSALDDSGFRIEDDPEAIRQQALTDVYVEEYDKRTDALSAYAMAAGSIFGSLSSLISGTTKEQTKEQKAAIKVLFLAQKAAALATASINLSKAISEANALPFPTNIPAIAAASVVGGAAIAAIVAETITGLVADEGVTSADLRRMGFTGRQTVALRRDEMVLGPQASTDASRIADALGQTRASLEAPQASGGGTMVAVYLDGEQIGGSVQDLLIRRLRLGDLALQTELAVAGL
jgi:hypothetical protein